MKKTPKNRKAPAIHRLRATCVSGPWLDEECVRYIDVPETANLYDLHVAIQDAVQFDDEFKFHYFVALAPDGEREPIPAADSADFDPDVIDTDVYEDLLVLDHVKAGARKALFYVFLSEYDDWVFKIQHTGESHEPVEGEFYPLVVESLSVGPDPEEYGSGFDDFAESDEDFKPFRIRPGEADFNPDDENESDNDAAFGFGDDDDDEDGDDEEDDEEEDGDAGDDEDEEGGDDEDRW